MTLSVLALAFFFFFNSNADLPNALNASFYLFIEVFFFFVQLYKAPCLKMWTIYSVFIPAAETEQHAGSQVSQLEL